MKSSQVKTILLVYCGQGFNKEYQGHYNRYKVLVNGTPIEEIYGQEELKELSYWVNRSKVMAMNCWGTSQEFEAMLSIGDFLKLYRKAKKEEWGKYTRLLEDKIKVIY